MDYKSETKPKKTWAQMAIDEEEEDLREEMERQMVEKDKLRILVAFRRHLYSLGMYQLEDGEILE